MRAGVDDSILNNGEFSAALALVMVVVMVVRRLGLRSEDCKLDAEGGEAIVLGTPIVRKLHGADADDD